MRLWKSGIDENEQKRLVDEVDSQAGKDEWRKIRRWRKTNPAGWFGGSSKLLAPCIVAVEGAFDRLALLAAGLEAQDVLALVGTALQVETLPLQVQSMVLAVMVIQQWLIEEGTLHDPHRSLVKATQTVSREANRLHLGLIERNINTVIASIARSMQSVCRLNSHEQRPNRSQYLTREKPFTPQRQLSRPRTRRRDIDHKRPKAKAGHIPNRDGSAELIQ